MFFPFTSLTKNSLPYQKQKWRSSRMIQKQSKQSLPIELVTLRSLRKSLKRRIPWCETKDVCSHCYHLRVRVRPYRQGIAFILNTNLERGNQQKIWSERQLFNSYLPMRRQHLIISKCRCQSEPHRHFLLQKRQKPKEQPLLVPQVENSSAGEQPT